MDDLISKLIARSRAAIDEIKDYTQEEIDKLAAAVVYALSEEKAARSIAEMAYNETGMGLIESKFIKMNSKIPGCFYDVKGIKTVGVIERIIEKGITKIAKPVGVIAALIPSTNPEATPVFIGLLGLRGLNGVIFSPHPASTKTTTRVVEMMREVLRKNGAPEDLFICIDKPSKELAKELMSAVDLVTATGSSEVVHAAYSSGTPAYGVGVGNAVIVVDETADVVDAAGKILIGKTGDNASGCSAENSLVVQKGVYSELVAELERVGGQLLSIEEKARLQSVLWVDGVLSRDLIARPAAVIAKAAGIDPKDGLRFLMVEEESVGKEYPFSGEKLSLVLTLYKYDEFSDAIDKVNDITMYSGLGHSCGIHSSDKENIEELALRTKTSRVTVRQPHGVANSGSWFNGLAFTFSIGCGTWGGNSISENVTQKHFINVTQLAEPIERVVPTREEIFGDLLEGMELE